ncbi:family 2A encapsulin nanocompartment cargo protein cysteine desulfurase [uncultured Thiothrix sp.]|uniref:family 2A encapsulin nanocompartment cargo protein cysteine desulfurase n=1 Tax=uncultured Thiothrix sp. TaxID=223185 RepID=UPI0026321ED2|nr:family 2A encapsulin nanocompartment cargo protein cysteine desulfurase [uncultured Thiothrix sp.]HMT94320.1 family 2A encapsulin nanocompartment cargo protein cysteine desulfurase [Thiolinea sp.]
MTTQAPISNLGAAPVDETWLAQLASSLFGSLPTETPSLNNIPPSVTLLPHNEPQHWVNTPALLQRAPAVIANSLATATPAYTYPDFTGKPKGLGLPDFDLSGLDLGLVRANTQVPSAANAIPHDYFLEHSVPVTSQVQAPAVPSVANSTTYSGFQTPIAIPPRTSFDIHAIRRDFPILQERVNGKPLIWFDNAATTQKPQVVLNRLSYFYQHENSNVHRAAHELAARASDAYDGARQTVANFIGAHSVDEIIFVRGTTEGINLIAKTWGKQNLKAGDEVIVSHLEHHANIVPWQQLRDELGIVLKVIPVDDRGQLLLNEYRQLLSPKTKLVSVTQVSNALGTITPIEEIIALAHAMGAKVLIDGAQGISHIPVNVQTLDADFYVFSGHKIFGPTGIGAIYGKAHLLETMQPWQGGGNMIEDVTFEHTVYRKPPLRFEAGTGNIADAVGLAAALDYVSTVGLPAIAAYEHALVEYASEYLRPIKGVRLIGTAPHKASVVSFVLEGYTTEQVGKALNQEGIAVRTGHHCAQPILRRFGLEATVRPSLAFYNTFEEIDVLVGVVKGLSRKI